MTQTPPPHDTESEQRSAEPGVDRANLRSYERLRRSTTDRKIAGVAGGLGHHLNIDPTVIRVLLVVLIFFGGAGLVLYGAAWLIVPEEGSDKSVVETSPSTRNALLIAAAVIAAMLLVGDSWGGFGFPWPLLLLALVVFAVLVGRDRSARPASPPPPAPPAGSQQTAPGSADRPEEATSAQTAVVEPPAPAYSWQPPAGGGQYTYEPPTPPAPRPDRGPKLFGITLAVVALALGVLGTYDVAGGSVVSAAYPALALAVVGVMLVVGSFFGRPGGLIFLGIVAALVLAPTAAVDDASWSGDTTVFRTPPTAAAVADDYSVTAGQIALDLTEVDDLENLDGRTVALDATAGEVLVRVPEGLDVAVDSDIGWGGEIVIDGVRQDGGGGVSLDRSIDGGTDVPELDLNIDLMVGRIEVVQEEAA